MKETKVGGAFCALKNPNNTPPPPPPPNANFYYRPGIAVPPSPWKMY